MSALVVDDVVRVVAEKLANGAPHPFFGRKGLVSEIRTRGHRRVRVHIVGPGGRAVMFSADELEHVRDDATSQDVR